jgi:hypothetical protein
MWSASIQPKNAKDRSIGHMGSERLAFFMLIVSFCFDAVQLSKISKISKVVQWGHSGQQLSAPQFYWRALLQSLTPRGTRAGHLVHLQLTWFTLIYCTYHWFSRVYKCLELSTVRSIQIVVIALFLSCWLTSCAPQSACRIKCISFSVKCFSLLKSPYVSPMSLRVRIVQHFKQIANEYKKQFPVFPVPFIAKYIYILYIYIYLLDWGFHRFFHTLCIIM